jgi:hypothetical protein
MLEKTNLANLSVNTWVLANHFAGFFKHRLPYPYKFDGWSNGLMRNRGGRFRYRPSKFRSQP